MTALRRNATIAWAIARKDAIAEVRGKQAAVSTLTFAAVVLLLFGFVASPPACAGDSPSAGCSWHGPAWCCWTSRSLRWTRMAFS